jgi:hypothetical protein
MMAGNTKKVLFSWISYRVCRLFSYRSREWHDYVFVNCSWVATRWQYNSTHLHTNSTQNDTKQTIHRTAQKFSVLNRNTAIYTLIKKYNLKNMKECDNSKIHTNSNPIFSVCLLIMFDTLFLRPTLHCNISLHFTTLHPTTLHYTYRHFTYSHLHFTSLSFPLTHSHFLSFSFTSHH